MHYIDMRALRRGSLTLVLRMAALSPARDTAAWTQLGQNLVLKTVGDEVFRDGFRSGGKRREKQPKVNFRRFIASHTARSRGGQS
jgi:hypothetical protein